MATVTGLTAARMIEIEAASVVSGTINASGHLILTKHDGATIDAGYALVAVPDASDTQKGVVELATDAETASGSNSTLAVTPKSLASVRIKWLDQANYNNTTPTSAYPDGESLIYLDNITGPAGGWGPYASGDWWGVLHTRNIGGDTIQTWRSVGTGKPVAWNRCGNASGWGPWKRLATFDEAVQIIAPPAENAGPSAYPIGMSLTNVASGSGPVWSLNGGTGSITTVYQTTNRVFQTFVTNSGISPGLVQVWTRTYHSSGAWTAWAQMANTSDPSSIGMTGEIKIWPAATAPNGWMLCEGGAISRTTYAALFALIGTNYGVGDGSTTFNVPDMRGRVPAGFDSTQPEFNTRGKTGGEKTHVLTQTEMPSHTHTQNPHSHTLSGNGGLSDSSGSVLYSVANGNYYGFWTSQPSSTTATNQNTGGDGAHNNLQPYLTMKYIIKL